MHQKNVLVLTTTFPRWENDTTPRFVYELSEILSLRFNLIVLAPHYKDAKKNEFIGKIEVRRFVYFKPEQLQKLCYGSGIIPNIKKSFLAKIQLPFLMITEFFASCRVIKSRSISLIHAHWILPQGFIAVLLKKIFNKPIIVTIHGSDLFPLNNFLFKTLQKYVIKNADAVTVNSNATESELLSRFPYYSKKVHIIPMGVDINIFKKRKIKKPKRYINNKILLFVGRLSDQKGLQYLIDSLKNTAKHFPNIKLLIIGEGSYKETLVERAKQNEVENFIEFLGAIEKSKLAEYYNFADIFVMPSLSNKTGTEALGLALIEAMASGCAVIGTKIGGIKYLIKNDFNGILVEQKNSKQLSSAIINLLKDRKKAVITGHNASNYIKSNYSWDKVSRDFFKLYNEILRL